MPYRKEVVYKGVIYYDDHNFEKIEHKTTENKTAGQLERERIEYDLLKEGVMKRYDFGKFSLRVFNNACLTAFNNGYTRIGCSQVNSDNLCHNFLLQNNVFTVNKLRSSE